ncbi:MAG: carbohydrate kinase family protein [Candidatus Woesebacteria bacterium]|jgi:ribokinase
MSKKKPSQYTLLSLGSLYLDINSLDFPFTDALKAETETVGKEYEIALGGSAVIIAKITAKLNLYPIFVGKIGQDIPGDILKQLFKVEGIFPALIEEKTVSTNLGINYVNNAGKTLMTVVGSANQNLKASDILTLLKKNIPKVKYLYLSGFFKLKQLIPFYEKLLDLAHDNNVKVVLDHGRVTNNASQQEISKLRKIVKNSEIYLPSETEFSLIWGAGDFKKAWDKYKPNKNQILVVKRAEKGARAKVSKEEFLVPGLKVKTVNTVGAGDCFNAAFIKALEMKKSVHQAVKFANAAAAYKISHNSLPSIKLLERYAGI